MLLILMPNTGYTHNSYSNFHSHKLPCHPPYCTQSCNNLNSYIKYEIFPYTVKVCYKLHIPRLDITVHLHSLEPHIFM